MRHQRRLMKWANDIDPSTDNYRNTSADMARVAHMTHRFVDEPDRTTVLAMLFQSPKRRSQS